MSNENAQLAVLPPAALARKIEPAMWNSLKELYDEPSDQSLALAIDYCTARKLDVMKKPVHIVPVWSKRRGRMVDTIWPSILEVRATAMRTKQYAGADETVFGSTVKQDLGEVKGFEFPEWAQVTVYRMIEGQRCKFPGPKVYFLEVYATAKKDSFAPNAMWFKRPWGQLEKCAEAAALRRAFPEEASYTAEEMAGRTIDDMVNVTGTATPEATATDPATGAEVVKRPPVPGKRGKGASGLGVTPAAPAPAPEAPPAEPEQAPISVEAVQVAAEPAPAAQAPAPESAPAPAEQPPSAEPSAPVSKPAAAEPAPETSAASKSVWPMVVRGTVVEARMSPVKNNPDFKEVPTVRLSGIYKIGTTTCALGDLGRLIMDPKRFGELKAFWKVGDEEIDFTIEEQPSTTNPEKKNKVIIKAEVADVAM
jgi:phage recombination protein Bet